MSRQYVGPIDVWHPVCWNGNRALGNAVWSQQVEGRHQNNQFKSRESLALDDANCEFMVFGHHFRTTVCATIINDYHTLPSYFTKFVKNR